MLDWNRVPALTPGMKNLGNQFNKRFPKRDSVSDGAWGDWEHEQHSSAHNPDDTKGSKPEWDGDADKVPDIRGIDVDNNLNDPSCDMTSVVEHLRTVPKIETVLRYWIYNRLIYHVNTGFAPRTYTGSSPHTEHAHFSGAWTESADQNSMFDFQLEKVGNFMVARDLPLQGDRGTEVGYWQYKHNAVRMMFSPPLPVLTVDNDYGPKMAAAVASFWKAIGTNGDFDGSFIPGWLAMNYDKWHAEVSARPSAALITNVIDTYMINHKIPLVISESDDNQLRALVSEWLKENVVGLEVQGNVSGKAIIK